jgi:hypothetical protein
MATKKLSPVEEELQQQKQARARKSYKDLGDYLSPPSFAVAEPSTTESSSTEAQRAMLPEGSPEDTGRRAYQDYYDSIPERPQSTGVTVDGQSVPSGMRQNESVDPLLAMSLKGGKPLTDEERFRRSAERDFRRLMSKGGISGY